MLVFSALESALVAAGVHCGVHMGLVLAGWPQVEPPPLGLLLHIPVLGEGWLSILVGRAPRLLPNSPPPAPPAPPAAGGAGAGAGATSD